MLAEAPARVGGLWTNGRVKRAERRYRSRTQKNRCVVVMTVGFRPKRTADPGGRSMRPHMRANLSGNTLILGAFAGILPSRHTRLTLAADSTSWKGNDMHRALASTANTDRPTVVCAWCSALLERGGDYLSHGICVACSHELLAQLSESAPMVANRIAMVGSHA